MNTNSMIPPQRASVKEKRVSNCFGTKIALSELEEAIALVPDCINGCYRAQVRLYKVFAKPMLHFCMKLTKGNLPNAQDIVQESFAKVFCQLHTLKCERSLHVWVTRIFYSEAVDAIRMTRRKRHHHNYYYTIINEEVLMMPEEPDFEFSNDLDIVLLRFVHRHQNLFKMVANGYSYEDIGQELNMPEGTVKSIISRERIKNRANRAQFLGLLRV